MSSRSYHLLNPGGTYGNPNAGDPIQYDELRIEHDQGDVEIIVYNRALLLLTTESEVRPLTVMLTSSVVTRAPSFAVRRSA